MSPHCVFCGNGNPPGAKYCNECASPLHLRPCNECDAINDRSAPNCHTCVDYFAVQDSLMGRSVEPLVAMAEVEPYSDATPVSQEIPRLESGTQAPVHAVTIEAHRELPRFVAELVHRFASEPGFVPRHPSPASSNRAKTVDGERLKEVVLASSPLSRLALPIVFGLAMVVSAYFGFRHPMNEGTSTQGVVRPLESVPGAASAAPDPVSNDAVLRDKSTPPPENEGAASSVTQGAVETPAAGARIGSNVADPSSVPPSTSTPQQSPSSDETVERASTAPAVSAEPKAREVVTPLPTRRPTPRAATSGAVRASPGVDVLGIKPAARQDSQDAERQRRQEACAERTAALGLCDQTARPKEDEGK